MSKSPETPETPEQGQSLPEYFASETTSPSSMLMKLLEKGSSRRLAKAPDEDMGLAEHLPFPFMALVGQFEMRMALLMGVINPNIGGVLLVGPRGTGKTTAARGMSDLLPLIETSICPYGCMPEDYETQGADGVCEDCAAKLQAGKSITRSEPVRLVELPLNSRLEDVVGGINERLAMQENRVKIERGILSRADRNLLYVDEVNLLGDEIVDAILDAAAQGQYTVRRGPVRATYRARFVLIGSMNPEEGNLRPQILDRFGLRVLVNGLSDSDERITVYDRVRQFRANARAFIQHFDEETYFAREDIMAARNLLPTVTLSADGQALGLKLVQELSVHSHRAEFTLFEAARAYAAADGRNEATLSDVKAVAPMALRMRRSEFMDKFFESQKTEDQQIHQLLDQLAPEQA
jgi:magnesium chelatase subunit I